MAVYFRLVGSGFNLQKELCSTCGTKLNNRVTTALAQLQLRLLEVEKKSKVVG